jgi:TolB protein
MSYLRKASIACLFTLVIGAKILPQTATADEKRPIDGKIAFVSERTGFSEVFLMESNGASQQQLTYYEELVSWPSFSPDGKRIAYVLFAVNKPPELVTVDTTGHDPHQLNRGRLEAVWFPAWSPDSKQLVFAGVGNERSGLMIMDQHGAYLRAFLPAGVQDAFPSWSPDGKTIAFSARRDGETAIYLVDNIGYELHPLMDASTGRRVEGWMPVWSPDGKQIAFISLDYEISVINSDGTNRRVLTPYITTGYYAKGYPTWSPDGSKIAFEANPNGNWDIYTIDVRDSTIQRVTTDPAVDSHPSWQPIPADRPTSAAPAIPTALPIPTIPTTVPQPTMIPTFMPR